MRDEVNKPMKATLTVYRHNNGQYEYCFASPSEQQPYVEAHIAKLGGKIMFSITGFTKPLESLPDGEGPFDALKRRAAKETRIRGFFVSSLEFELKHSD